MAEITYLLENGEKVVVSAGIGNNLLEVARGANVAIDAPCSGNGACGKCRVRLVEGAIDAPRTSHISDEEYAEGWRLSCACKIEDDRPITVLVPDIASAYQSRIRTADLSDEREIKIFTDIQDHMNEVGLGISHRFDQVTFTMDEPTLDDTMPDNERFERAFLAAVGCDAVELSFHALRRLAAVMREKDFAVTAIYEKQAHRYLVYDVFPAGTDIKICALAIDIGTTTVTGALSDLTTGEILSRASAGNGQIRYGADVINRIIEQTKEGGIAKLQKAIIDETLIPLIDMMVRDAGIEKGQIVRMSVASNTTMNHLFVGASANSLRMEPYIPTFFRCPPVKAGNLRLPVNPLADLFIAPNIGSYVGGDITAGTMASMVWNKEEFSLFIDLGTNGEIVFGNNEFLMSCACSAGPAFEGGDISCGMRATDGAIEAISIDKESMEPTVRIVGKDGQKPVGICGSGIIDVISELFRCGIIDSKGKFVREGARVRRDAHDMGRYVLFESSESETGREICINEVDIESFIRAKGAIFSAIDTMLQTLDMTPEVLEHIYIAGGIGSGIDIENAIRIGMLPDVDREKYAYIGNSSLAGSYAISLSDAAYEKVLDIASNMTYLELSTYPGYMDHFVAACFLPHTDASLFPSVQV
ncbi:MAG: DUF4445 domain-containing protein [Lachnospiraceae bacterium]|nr:DUF4445 domain-containing protein [Lachnospiraceae bacterium]